MDSTTLHARLTELEQEHRDLDDAIRAMQAGSRTDQLQIQRMKKRKLSLRDQMAALNNILVPDIIA